MRTRPKCHVREVDHQTVTLTQAKYSKDSKYQLATSNCFAVLQEESDGQQKTSHSGTPKPPIYVGVQNISPMIRLLEQIAKEQYQIKAFADNQVKVQPKNLNATAQLQKP
jgi:hypothetical protein